MGDKQIKKKQGNKYDENIPGVGYCRNTGNPFYFDPEDYDKIKDYTWSDRWRNGYHELRAWDSNIELPEDNITKEQALEAMNRIFNYCEEIDWHIPEEERTGYHMLPDVQLVERYIMSKES